jgi:YebC/PmpR family DNA-binding regulatory protein
MAGHSKWNNIKRKKEKVDAARGKVFTKIIKEITTAARMGGGDLESNARLRTAVDIAKGANMPKDNIEKAIKKGTGELPGVSYEELNYEGYGPGGVAVYIEAMTDNKNRTAGEFRFIFSKHGGNMGESGCVGWMFDHLGEITIKGESLDEEKVMEDAIESGATDVQFDEGEAYIYTEKDDLFSVVETIKEKGYAVGQAVLTRIPQNTVKLEGKPAVSMIKMMELFEDHDDVQNIYANFDIPDEVFEEM